MVFCYTDLQLTFVYLGAMATCFFGFFLKWLFDCCKESKVKDKRQIAKPSREFFLILEQMRKCKLGDIHHTDYGTLKNPKDPPLETVIKVDEIVEKMFHTNLLVYADKIEDAVAGKGMRNCDRFDNWKDAMSYYYMNVCNMSEKDSESTIMMSNGEPSSAFMTWLYSYCG